MKKSCCLTQGFWRPLYLTFYCFSIYFLFFCTLCPRMLLSLLLLSTRPYQFNNLLFFNLPPPSFLRIWGLWHISRNRCSYKQKSRYWFCSFLVMTSEPQHQYNNEAFVGFHSPPQSEPCLCDFVCCYCQYSIRDARPQAGSSKQTTAENSHKQIAFVGSSYHGFFFQVLKAAVSVL